MFRSSTKRIFHVIPHVQSFNLLCAISIERYIYIVHNRFYKRTVTKKLLAIVIISLILISFIWATTDAHLRAKLDIVKLAKTYITLWAYSGTVLATGVVFNVALLRNVKRKTQKSLAQHILDSRVDNRYHGDCLFTSNHSYQYCCYISSADKFYIKKRGSFLLWALMPSQFNAVLNSVIYLTRSSCMRRYYCKFFNCRNKENKMKKEDPRNWYPKFYLNM